MIYDYSGETISRAYDCDGNLLSRVYDADGNMISNHAVSEQFTRTLMFKPSVPTGTQGIACDSITQTIAQLYAGKICLVDVSDGSYVDLGNINLGHGHTGQFAPTRESGQEYPLLYVSGYTNTINDSLYVCLLEVACTSSSATLNKTYAIPAVSDLTGTLRTCIDFENSIVYTVAASTYYDEADYTYITAWDMSTTTLLSENVYALTNKLDEFQIPFIPEMQSCTFFDGLIVALSDQSAQSAKYCQFIDVETKDIYMTIQGSKLLLSGETEGVGFLYNNETNKYDMIISQRNNGAEYYRYEFV